MKHLYSYVVLLIAAACMAVVYVTWNSYNDWSKMERFLLAIIPMVVFFGAMLQIVSIFNDPLYEMLLF